ncbi:MAG TPA: HD domain-containing protein [Acidobacteriota bacterium]|nr:HD domain-containing protein [Acidobacteriota bacterium]HND18772.1 HD domain-containing protein [Acidobacteriota bacterium]HNG94393.1 HD domain-containing protein [Acidobacteriota bacterium]
MGLRSPAQLEETQLMMPQLLRNLRRVMAQKYAGSGYSLVVHGEEVGLAAAQIARILHRAHPECEQKAQLAYLAGALHDYGKIVVPDEIRLSRQVYSESERQVMEYHPIYGKLLLESVGCHEEIVAAAYYHHLRYGGGGYPNCGLTGDQIPLIARMVTVADHFIARIEHRPHRPGQCPIEVWADMQRQRHILFDPRVLDAFEETELLQSALGTHPLRIFA